MPKLNIESLVRSADFQPATFNEDKMTVEAVISTGAAVVRRDARGTFTEILNLRGVDVEGGALKGLPLLDGHKNTGGRDVIGRVLSGRREGENIIATVRLSSASDVAPIVQRIREGTLTGVSMGYRAKQTTESVGASGERIRTITPDIHEISLIPVPADSGATIRSQDDMPNPTTEETIEREQPTRAETRAAIRAIARSAGLGADWADQQIDADADLTAVRAAAFEAMQTRRPPNFQTQIIGANDDPAVILERHTAGLTARVNGQAPEDAARPYFNMSLLDHARAFVSMNGQTLAGMDREQIFRAAMHTTSDFPNLLTGVGNRTLMPAYKAAESPLKRLARQALHSDFRAKTRLKLSGTGLLEKVTESGEIKSTARGEATESYALDTYASMFSLSRKALINDDLGAFRDWGTAAGQAAAQTEANLLFTLLTQSSGAGPVMGEDNVRLFHTSHGNIASPGTDLYSTGLDAFSDARLALRQMKALDGKTAITNTPKYLLVGPELETTAEQMLAEISAQEWALVNPFSGKLSLLIEPRLTGEKWYLFADPAAVAVLEYAYLSSAQGPQIASREGWDVLGMEFRVVLDFGCGPVDYRGAYYNPGT